MIENDDPYRPPSEPFPTPTIDLSPSDPSSDVGAAPNRVPPRVWTAIFIPILSLVLFLLASSVMILVAFLVVHGRIDAQVLMSEQGMEDVSSSRIGLVLLIVVPQMFLVIPSIAAAFLSPVATGERLSLVRGHWPIWAWIAAALTTPVIGWISTIFVGMIMEESDHIRMTTEMFRTHGESGFLIPLALMIGITPAFCEELLFRGYLQTRLERIFGPAIAILVSSVLFAIFHIDWMHAVAVFPLGLFLGFVAWRSGSLLPAMVAHCFNNMISVVAVALGPSQADEKLSQPMLAFLAVVITAGIYGTLLVGFATWKYPIPEENPTPTSSPVPAADEPPVAV